MTRKLVIEGIEATLEDSGLWVSANTELEELLNQLTESERENYSPAFGLVLPWLFSRVVDIVEPDTYSDSTKYDTKPDTLPVDY